MGGTRWFFKVPKASRYQRRHNGMQGTQVAHGTQGRYCTPNKTHTNTLTHCQYIFFFIHFIFFVTNTAENDKGEKPFHFLSMWVGTVPEFYSNGHNKIVNQEEEKVEIEVTLWNALGRAMMDDLNAKQAAFNQRVARGDLESDTTTFFQPVIRLFNIVVTLYKERVVVRSCDGGTNGDYNKTTWYFYENI